MEHRKLAHGFALDVPDEWELEVDPAPGILLVAAEPRSESGAFRASIVMTANEVPATTTLRDVQLATEIRQANDLPDYNLLDLEHVTMAGGGGVRRLASYTHETRVAVTLLQWAVLAGGREVVLTASTDTMRSPAMMPLFYAVLGSLVVANDPLARTEAS